MTQHHTKRLERLELEGVTILFKNFSGQKSQYNVEGNRNFSILIPEEDAANLLIDQGWNIKPLRAVDGDRPEYHLPVKVDFGGRTRPRAQLIKRDRRVPLSEDTISMLDYVPVERVDVVLNPYYWDVNGKQGVKAYLNSIYVIVDENQFDIKYDGLPEVRVGQSLALSPPALALPEPMNPVVIIDG